MKLLKQKYFHEDNVFMESDNKQIVVDDVRILLEVNSRDGSWRILAHDKSFEEARVLVRKHWSINKRI